MPCGIGFKDSRLQQPKACIPARKTGFNFMQLESGNKDDERREYRHVHTLQVVAPRGAQGFQDSASRRPSNGNEDVLAFRCRLCASSCNSFAIEIFQFAFSCPNTDRIMCPSVGAQKK